MGKIKIILFGVCLLFVGANTLHASSLKYEDADQCRAMVAATYTAQIGVHEITTNWSPEIKAYLETTGISFSAPWCAALVSYCYSVNGVPNPHSAWSPAYFTDRHCIDVKNETPLKADVFGVYYNNLKRIAHIGFIDRWPRQGDYFISVEGNTNDNGSREGTGVYKKRRLKRTAYRIARYI